MDDEKILNQLIETAEILKKQIEGLNIQLELIKEQINEHLNTIETLKGYKDTTDEYIYIDAGSSTYLFFQAMPNKNALIRIGSDVYVEYNLDKAIEILNERINDLKSVENKAIEEINKLSDQYNSVQDKIEMVYSMLSGRNRNVQGA
ncbi:MAG: prefoldin subunit alpha [Thermoplasmata archaeon]